ncbi:MAG: ATP-dependent zinc metalloprotease FtsH [Phycisphaerales bacterium]
MSEQPNEPNNDNPGPGNSNQGPGGPSGGGPSGGGQSPLRMNRNLLGWMMVLGLIAAFVLVVTNSQNQAKEVTLGEIVNYIQTGAAKKIIIKDDRIVVDIDTAKAPNIPPQVMIKLPAAAATSITNLIINAAKANNVTTEPANQLLIGLLSFVPWLLLFGLIYFFLFRAARGGGGGMGMLGNFGRSKHKIVSKEMTHVTLSDVAGVDEAKDEVQEIIEFLKHPKKFQRLGGRIPRGVLLIGPPGCGKTLLAKAVAGEAEVPFFSISGSDFVEMFVGVGASRVRDLFKQAKDSSPCIIFLDEIDAVGRRRGSGFSSGGHDEREQTLNAILVEMDGFETNDQVIVMAATNRSDVLDPALTRPGRFDRQITVSLPDLKGRLEILRVHAKRVKMSPSIDIERLARQTPMFSGADLAAIINEAAIIATMGNKDFVEMADLEEARDKVKFGRARKSRKIEEEERIGTAYHEAGHAVVQKLLPHADPVHKVTIIPRGPYLGATMSLPEKDRYGYGLAYLHDQLRVLCAGRIAENHKTGDVTSGASGDIRMATAYARQMVLEWGMSSRLGFVDYTPEDNPNSLMPERSYSDNTANTIDEEVKRLIDEGYADAQKMVDENWDKIVAVAEALLKHETLSADEVDDIMGGKPLHKPSVSELLANETKKATPNAGAIKPKPTGDAPPGAMPSPA